MARRRVRNIAFVQLVENLPENWVDVIDSFHVKAWAIQHEPDKEDSKPHVHCVMQFDGQKDLAVVLEMLEPFGVKHVENLHSLRGMLRYLLHMDNPEKRQYSVKDLHLFAGADTSYFRDSASDVLGFFSLYQQLTEKGIMTTIGAMRYLMDTGDVDMMEIFYKDLLKFDRLLGKGLLYK